MAQAKLSPNEFVLTEAHLLIADAVATRRQIFARCEAKAILGRYPDCDMSEHEIEALVLRLAAEKHLPVDTAY